jgi:hypothetical protein
MESNIQVPCNIAALTIGDVNDDGRIEIVIGNRSNKRIYLFHLEVFVLTFYVVSQLFCVVLRRFALFYVVLALFEM